VIKTQSGSSAIRVEDIIKDKKMQDQKGGRIDSQ